MSSRFIRPRIFTCRSRKKVDSVPTPWGRGMGGGGQLYFCTSVLPTNRLMGMCSWMGLHFTIGACFSKDPVSFQVRRQILKFKPVE